jgi:ABC-2 type transport system ATP-binding protein
MAAISVRQLRKTFAVRRKAAGLAGSVRALFKPDTHIVEAVRGISFEMEPGELLGFIGPNGAGKSTTIKILTGILHPSGGEASVLGHVPWRERRELAYKIGTVFGQRPQLWYHLPALDTFRLFGKIYELDDAEVRRRVALLAEAFELEELLDTPVRKLSLGQRMRCEVAASLLHRPRLLLLDEPSIGLDVVAKQRIRDTIRRMSELEGVGVLLTSHDAGDIEALCRRVIVVNHGQIVYQDKVSALKRSHLTSKLVEVRYAAAVPADFAVPGAELLKLGRYGAKLRFDTRVTPADALVARLAAAGELVDITISDPSLEEVIRTIYEARAPEEEVAA